MAIGPIAHYHENSRYYSAVKPRPNKIVDNDLPHITIQVRQAGAPTGFYCCLLMTLVQMPVYKESLDNVL